MARWLRLLVASCLTQWCVWSAGPAYAAEPTLAAATADQRRAAQKTFEAADELYEMGHYSEALTTYRASYALVASPNSLLMIARSLRELGKLVEAYREFQRAHVTSEQSGGRYAQTALAARDEGAALRSRVGLLRIMLRNAPVTTPVFVDQRRVPSVELAEPIALAPGPHHIEAQLSRSRIQQDVFVKPGADLSVTLDARTQSAAPRPQPAAGAEAPATAESRASGASGLRTGAWLASGVGVAGVGVFGVFGLLNNAQYAELEKPCATAACAAERPDAIDTGKKYQLVANAGLIVGLAGLSTGAVLFVLSSSGTSEPTLKAQLGPSSVQLSGRF